MPASHDPAAAPESSLLALRLLGPMDLLAAGRQIPLPRSKKTRALLAYLAVTDRPQRRDRLCSLLWDVTDDPRGALRWSLSRLRSVLGDDAGRIQTDQDEIRLSATGMLIDVRALARLQRRGFANSDTQELEQASTIYRGEFLEGLELPDFLDFSAWCIEQRERSRKCHCELLSELVGRLGDEPGRALPFARQRVQFDVLNLAAHQDLLRMLLRLENVTEAQQRFEHAQRLFRQVSAPSAIALDKAWKLLRAETPCAVRPAATAHPLEPPVDAAAMAAESTRPPFVGRRGPLARLESLLQSARVAGGTALALVTGEAGLGKTRLAERVSTAAMTAGFAVIAGRAFEAESNRPFGPWADALAVDVGEAIASNSPSSREGLFETLRTRLTDLAATHSGVLVVLDDLQWFDRNSAELLHYLVRTYDRSPMVVLMLARSGELPDNEAVTRLLRGLQRDHTVHSIELEPLSRESIGALCAGQAGIDVDRLHEASAGNPLYALEFVRAHRGGIDGTPPTLLQLVRERVSRLPDHAADVLRWGAVLGHALDLGRLEGLMSQPADQIVGALERLEQSSLLRIDASRLHERYVFAHELVREAVYGELSHPRRRLMHRRVAQLLEPLAADPTIAAELAHHASLAGEALLGVRACIAAGHHALRLFANDDAEALARRGLRLAEELEEPSRVEAALDLLEVQYAARAPDRDEAAARVRILAERALDFGLARSARQGFQMVSYLRWAGSSLADAHANILQAERVSRLAEPGERAVALAQAARCLVLLERNLQQAEAFMLEADAVSRRQGRTSAAVAFGLGMIAARRGETAEAAEAFIAARDLARQQGEHLAEFMAIEHHVMLEIDQGRHKLAETLAADLVELGARVRPGAEAHIARALHSLARLQGGAEDDEGMRQAADAVRRADAKFELSYVLARWAEVALKQEREEATRAIATEALEIAQAMGRSSEIGDSLVLLAEVAQRRGERDEFRRRLEQLEKLGVRDLSARSRQRIAAVTKSIRPAAGRRSNPVAASRT